VKRILLLGAGHAHLVVLRSLVQEPLHRARIMLVTPHTKQVYSGMLPGILAGHYRRADAEVDVAALAERAYVELEQGLVERLDLKQRMVLTKGGKSFAYDVASLNVGSQIARGFRGAQLALAVKPYEEFLARLRMAERIAVVGGGVAGAEIAMALRYRGARVTLYGENPLLSPRVRQQLQKREVDYRPGMAVTAIEPGLVVVSGTARQDFELALLATGATPAPWLRSSGLATDERGFALVAATLQSVSHPEVFAVGDCATLREAPHPKSGVYAVRHGQTLADNLRRIAGDVALEAYVPQGKALALIACGARYAIAERGNWSAQGLALWWWKDRIDRRWVGSFR
jgi:pyridine nucleotide-disulfide oxidoreductase family protein